MQQLIRNANFTSLHYKIFLSCIAGVLLESTNSNNTPAFIHYRITNTEIGEYLAM